MNLTHKNRQYEVNLSKLRIINICMKHSYPITKELTSKTSTLVRLFNNVETMFDAMSEVINIEKNFKVNKNS